MGKPVLAIAVAALAALAALTLWQGARAPTTPAEPDTSPTPVEQPSALSIPDDATAPVEALVSSDRRVEDSGPAASPLPTQPTDAVCTVRGLVVDEEEHPLADVTVRIAASPQWAEGVEAPRLSDKYNIHGWELLTDASGAFRFDVPVPTADRNWLEIEPGPLLARVRLDFRSTRPALVAGDNDLGMFRLAVTGAIRGTVRDDRGLPIEKAKLDVGDAPSTTYGYGAETSASGEYLVPHVPAGSYGLGAKADGYLSRFVKPVVVERGNIAMGPDFVLERAPTLRGRIADEKRRPIEGVRLWGRPASSGAGAGGKSAPDGSFVIYLPQDEPYTLEATANGFQPFGVGDRTKHYAPGTDDISITLKADVTTRFVVIDETGSGVEHFGLRINRNQGKQAAERSVFAIFNPPSPKNHLGGVVDLGARPGIDRFQLQAPGYLEMQGEVLHDVGAPGQQTLRLSRGRSISGRVLAAGAPVEGLAVTLTPGRFMQGKTDIGTQVQTFSEDPERRSTAVTNAQGRFVLEAIERDRVYLLHASHPKKGVLRRLPVKAEEQETDLGDLVLVPRAAIAGLVLLPDGVAPAGHAVYLGGREDDFAWTDGAGLFRFDGLGPGSYVLEVAETPGLVGGGNPFGVDLAAGETKEVVLDCTARIVSALTLLVDLGGAPTLGGLVQLHPIGKPDQALELGQLDADGRVSGFVRAGGEASLVIWIPDYAPLRHPTARVSLAQGMQPEQKIEFELGSLVLELPGTVVLPAVGNLELKLGDQSYRVEFAEGRSAMKFGRLIDGGRRFQFDLLPVGMHELEVRLVDEAAQNELAHRPDGKMDFRKPLLYEAQASVTIVHGEVAKLVLR